MPRSLQPSEARRGRSEIEVRSRREADVLAGIAQRINASLDLGAVLQAVTDGARELCECEIATIALPEPGGGVRYRCWSGPASDPRHQPLPSEIEVAEQVLSNRRPFRTDNLHTDPRLAPTDGGSHADLVAMTAVPVSFADRIEGVLSVLHGSEGFFSAEHEAILCRLAEQAAVAIQNAEVVRRLQQTSDRLREVGHQLIRSQEREREAIARELHDDIGQLLTVLSIRVEAAQIPNRWAREQINKVITTILERVRDLTLSLKPPLLQEAGLESALLWHFAEFGSLAGIHIDFRPTGLDRRLPTEIENAAFRIVQEALTNVARHSGVREARVLCTCSAGQLEIQIEDVGRGFDPAQQAGPVGGLRGMRERARMLGGAVIVDSVPGVGTQLRVFLPIPSTSPPQLSESEHPSQARFSSGGRQRRVR